jgi:hypothetical protein
MSNARIVNVAFKTKGDPAVYRLPVMVVGQESPNFRDEIAGRLGLPLRRVTIVSP